MGGRFAGDGEDEGNSNIAIINKKIYHDQFLGFGKWQLFESTPIFLLCKTIIIIFLCFISSSYSYSFSTTTLILTVISFIIFHVSLVHFSTSIILVAAPLPLHGLSFLQLLKLPLLFYKPFALPPDFRVRRRITLCFLHFLGYSGISAFASVVCLCGFQFVGALGFRGFVVGLTYGFYYVFVNPWVLDFPILQRPVLFSYKSGFRKAIVKAVRLSTAGYFISSLVLPIFIRDYYKLLPTGDFVVEQIVFYFASCVVFLCWELDRHLVQVFFTKRYMFAPPKGSAAAGRNPSGRLLGALENSTIGSLTSHLAYLDLCMVCETNVDTWRRAAFFEETGDTYNRVMAACLKPLEQFTLDMGEGLGNSIEKSASSLSHQLHSSTELFYDSQVYEWCVRIASSLTIRSRKEDRFGIAQISGCNAATVSTLLACLLAIETSIGKKTNLPSSRTGPASIKWAALSLAAKRDPPINKKDGYHYSKAYSMADILRTAIYQIVSSFYHEMVTSSKTGLLEKCWITSGKPLYGSRELLVHKLRMFLEFQAN